MVESPNSEQGGGLNRNSQSLELPPSFPSALEALNKRQVTLETAEILKRAYEHLKLINAGRIAQDMLYATQRVFDYETRLANN